MKVKNPHYIAIEGGDGSGKATQTRLLVEYLKSKHKDVLALSFPQYDKPSARIAARYLNGEYGAANDVPADLAALAYAIDRADKQTIELVNTQLNKPNAYIISDRSVASNLAHQGTKFDSKARRKQFYEEMMQIEFDVLGEPKPQASIILLVPADIAQQNVDKKATRNYTSLKRDVHEADTEHLDKALRNYVELAELYPDEFIAIWAINPKTHKMRPIDEIQDEIRQIINM